MIYDFFKYSFLQNALIASLLCSVICGVIGVIIYEKKLVMMSGGIAHTAYGGVGLGYLLNFNPLLGAGIFSVTSALIIGTINRKTKTNTDIIISLFWSLGMASGVIFTSLIDGYPPDMNAYLFGNILSVSENDIKLMLILAVIILILTITFFNSWKAYMFDSEFAKIRGLSTSFFEYLLLILTALSVVVLIRAVGIILVIALLSAPTATASLLTKKLQFRMIISFLFCAVFCISGLIISYNFGISSGAAIVFVSVITYFIILLTKKIIKH